MVDSRNTVFRVARTIAPALLTLGAICLPGCYGPSRKDIISEDFRGWLIVQIDVMRSLPQPLEVATPDKTSEVVLRDLVLGIPEGVKAEILPAAVELDYDCRVRLEEESSGIRVDSTYVLEGSWKTAPSQDFQRLLEPFADNPRNYMAQYNSDLDFFLTACRTTTVDLWTAEGEELERVRNLLFCKGLMLFSGPKHMKCPQLQAFLHWRAWDLHADLFDLSGKYRGFLIFNFAREEEITNSPSDGDKLNAEQLTAQVLVLSYFSEHPE